MANSHSHAATSNRPVLALVALAFSVACPDGREVTGADDARASSARQLSGDHESERPEFRWPTGAAHSVLRLDVEMGNAGGTIEIELMPELAPRSVDHIESLVRDGYYDGTTFHRVIPGFMIQGGDPNSRDQDPSNDGRGGIDAALPDERSNTPFHRGVVALAHRGRPRSNSNQLFIMQTENRGLDGHYTAVGRITSGIDVVDRIANTPTDKFGRWGPKDRPLENVTIRRASLSSTHRDADGPQPEAARVPHALPPTGDAPDGTPGT